MTSTSNVEKAKRLATQLREILAKGGFRLTKWASNSGEVMASIPPSERAPLMVNLDFDLFPDSTALGVLWNIETDTFHFRIVKTSEMNTRRAMLSFVSSLFDPLGVAAPFILLGKQILQRLCQLNYDWDEEIRDEQLVAWNAWQESLHELSHVTIPRCLKTNLAENLCSVQLHSFSDASRLGYGAVTYLRLVDVNGKVNVAFLVGKSRVTPTKQVTIPRLELTAAVLAAKLNRQVESELEIPVDSSTFWTDSTVVLQYIGNRSTRFQTFVANRLSAIHSLSHPSQWRYVETSSNPADSASRGIKPSDSGKIQVWLNGPEFLYEEEEMWPNLPKEIKEMTDEDLEWRKGAQINEILANEQSRTMNDFLEYYSSWYRLQKGVAWLMRFLLFLNQRIHGEREFTSGPLTVTEIRVATKWIVRHLQQQHFPDVMKALRGNLASLKGFAVKRSQLNKLNPILVDGILRVEGRLDRATIYHSTRTTP